MKKLLILLLTVCTLCGCSSLRQVPVQLVREVQKDTVYLNKVQYDSVFVSQDRFIDRSIDTVFIRDISVQYKYRHLRDTVRIHQVDSIPVIREVEVVKTERYVPGIYKWSLGICIGLVVLLILYVLWKLK